MTFENKRFLFERMSLERIKEFAANLGEPVTDKRLAVPGIARALARKRSLTVAAVLAALDDSELRAACADLALASDGPAKVVRARLESALAKDNARAIRRAANREAASDFIAIPAKLDRVIDGDTIVVEAEGEMHFVRFRGIDAPETGASDKAEEDLDRSGLERSEMVALGKAATEWLERRLAGRPIYLVVQRTPAGPKKYLHHAQRRLLAYVVLDRPDGEDVCEAMLREGVALVWPRGVKTRRYLHPRSLAYVERCHAAYLGAPGLWAKGMDRLCPRRGGDAPREDISVCKSNCFRRDWRDGGTMR